MCRCPLTSFVTMRARPEAHMRPFQTRLPGDPLTEMYFSLFARHRVVGVCDLNPSFKPIENPSTASLSAALSAFTKRFGFKPLDEVRGPTIAGEINIHINHLAAQWNLLLDLFAILGNKCSEIFTVRTKLDPRALGWNRLRPRKILLVRARHWRAWRRGSPTRH